MVRPQTGCDGGNGGKEWSSVRESALCVQSASIGGVQADSDFQHIWCTTAPSTGKGPVGSKLMHLVFKMLVLRAVVDIWATPSNGQLNITSLELKRVAYARVMCMKLREKLTLRPWVKMRLLRGVKMFL